LAHLRGAHKATEGSLPVCCLQRLPAATAFHVEIQRLRGHVFGRQPCGISRRRSLSAPEGRV